MFKRKERAKVFVIAFMIGVILCLHYFTFPGLRYHHAFYRTLFYIPLILGSFWFGLKGSITICSSVLILFFPYVMKQWHGFAFEDFDRLLECILFVIITMIIGVLVERERKKHKALVQVESLAAVGRAVSEIAHDMKTPLMAIGGFTKQVFSKLGKDDSNKKKLKFVIQETARLESMVTGMLEFGKPLELKLAKSDLNETVRETMAVTQQMARKNGVILEMNLVPAVPSLMLDVDKVRQVFLNLVTNAIQASSTRQREVVRTFQESSSILMEVVDNGCGIIRENHANIFHPFFTTKELGTGLGLGIAKRIVEAHGGELSFYTNPKKGTTFSVRFPLDRPYYD